LGQAVEQEEVYSMSKATLIKLSAVSGILCGITWTIGDILLVGFKPDLAGYPAIMQSPLIRDKKLAVVMMEGSTERLAAGALIAAFTIPFMFFALYHLWQMIKSGGRRWAAVSIGTLFVAFAWSPLAHASYFYVGELCKAAVRMDGASAAPVFALAAVFIDFLYITWCPAIGLTGIGWLLVSVVILRGKTKFPRVFGLCTPLPLSIFFILIHSTVPSLIPDALAGAGFNLAAIIFYVLTTVFCFQKTAIAAS
jgi:hypothetical protein